MPAVVEAVAGILLNKGIVLVTSHRNEEALAVWDEIERRFGNSDEPAISKQVASALVSKGATLAQINRAEDAVGVWSDVVRRFGEGDASLYHEEIATAVLNRVAVLGLLNRPDEALEACDEALRRFGSSEELYGAEAVAQTVVGCWKIRLTLRMMLCDWQGTWMCHFRKATQQSRSKLVSSKQQSDKAPVSCYTRPS